MSFFNKILNSKPLESLTQSSIAQQAAQAHSQGMNVFKDVAKLAEKGVKHTRDEVIGAFLAFSSGALLGYLYLCA